MGGLIVKTYDGGKIWVELLSGTNKQLGAIAFPDIVTGYVVGDSGTIIKTTDSGSSWTVQPSGTFKDLRAVSFSDVNNGFIAGGSRWPSTDGIILKTTDGGSTWTTSFTDMGITLSTICFTDPNTGHAAGMESSLGLAVFLKTADAGSTWTVNYGNVTGSGVNSLYFIDADTGYAAGQNNIFYKTTDAGTTWDYISGGSMMTGSFNSVVFPGTNTGYIAGASSGLSGEIYKTTDGGVTWTYEFSRLDNGFNSVFFISSDTGYIVGGHGAVLKTTNGGGPPVGVQDFVLQNHKLKFSPNPTSGKFTCETDAESRVSVFNLNGQLMLTCEITKPGNQIDIRSLPVGIYIVRVVNDNEVRMGKIIRF